MTTIVVRAAARRDLAAILAWYESEGAPRAGRAMVATIRDVVAGLTTFPERHRAREYLEGGARLAYASPYVVVYTHDPIGDRIDVVRVVHGARDLAALLAP